MAVSSVSSNTNQVQHLQQSAPPVRAEKENDGDKDDGASTKINAPKPTVNTSGQTIGSTISVTA